MSLCYCYDDGHCSTHPPVAYCSLLKGKKVHSAWIEKQFANRGKFIKTEIGILQIIDIHAETEHPGPRFPWSEVLECETVDDK